MDVKVPIWEWMQAKAFQPKGKLRADITSKVGKVRLAPALRWLIVNAWNIFSTQLDEIARTVSNTVWIWEHWAGASRPFPTFEVFEVSPFPLQ
jgi:hypothetical protein